MTRQPLHIKDKQPEPEKETSYVTRSEYQRVIWKTRSLERDIKSILFPESTSEQVAAVFKHKQRIRAEKAVKADKLTKNDVEQLNLFENE